MFVFFSFSCDPRDLHSFPTRRSSDLFQVLQAVWYGLQAIIFGAAALALAAVWSTAAGIVFALVVAANLGLLRSEEHTSELQSHSDLVCRLLLEKINNKRLAERKSKCK